MLHPRTILIPIYPDVVLLDVAGPAQVLASAQPAGSYQIVLVSAAGGMVTSDSHVALASVAWSTIDLTTVDTVLVPGGRSALQPETVPGLLAWITQAAAAVPRIASVCLGAFVLAAAGVFGDRRATTHWRFTDELAARFPDLRVERSRLFVEDRGVWSSAGVSAGIDLALALVEADLGRAAAVDVAQRLVVFQKRPGDLAQESRTLAAQARDAEGRFDRLHSWIADNLDADLSIEVLADAVGMAPRSFARAYGRLGTTPAKAVEAMRLEAARTQLARPDAPSVQQIAINCGFVTVERLRRAMQRRFGAVPTALLQSDQHS